MKLTRTGKRRAAAINSIKILLTSASLAATFGGWAAISAANGSALEVAQVDATATVQSWLDSRSTAVAAGTATPVSGTNQTSTAQGSMGAYTATPAATTAATTVAPTATAVPTQVTVQPNIRTRSSK